MRNVLVIGGSYFAGRVFVEELCKQADTAVHVFNRGRRPLGMPGVAEHVGDRDRPEEIAAAIPPLDWDVVVDFCGYDPDQVRSLLDHLPGRVGHYIFISTTTAYAPSTRLPVDEGGALVSVPQPELGDYGRYGLDKARAEKTVAEECERRAVAWTIFRPAIIYGCYNYAPRETFFFDRLTSRQPIELPDGNLALFSFVWVVDMARLLIRALGNASAFQRIFNLAAPEAVSYRRIVDALCEITGKAIETTPLSVAEIERRGIPLPFPMTEHLLYDGGLAARTFEMGYTPFAVGLRDTLKYYLMVKRAEAAAG